MSQIQNYFQTLIFILINNATLHIKQSLKEYI